MNSPSEKYKMGDSEKKLLGALFTVRNEISKKFNVAPFVICSESSLQEMALVKPTTLSSFQSITGISKTQSEKYFTHFCDFFKDFCEKNDLKFNQSKNLSVKQQLTGSKVKNF